MCGFKSRLRYYESCLEIYADCVVFLIDIVHQK